MGVQRKQYTRNGAEGEEVLVKKEGRYIDSTHVLALAPHAGRLELNTGKQALRTAELCNVPTVGATAWVFRGFGGNQRAMDTWHVPSTKITPGGQFKLLGNIWDTDFYQGISFHGYSKDGILVGGEHDPDYKKLIAETLRENLPSEIHVQVATDPGEYSGMSDQNIVNRLSENSIQVEQSLYVRKNYWKIVAGTISAFYSESL